MNEDAYRENVLRHVTSGDRVGFYDFASMASAPTALPKYSGVLFVPWRAKSHRKHSADGFLRASDNVIMYLQSKGALVHESELARNEPDSQVHHLPRAYDDGLPSSAIRLRM